MLDAPPRPSAAPPSLGGQSRLQRARAAARRAAWRAVKRLAWWLLRQGWRQRRRLAPLYAAAGVWLAGALLWLPADGHRTALVLAAACTATGAGWWWLSRRRGGGRRWGRRRQAYVLAVWGFAWAWIVAASLVGPGSPLLGLLELAAVGFGVPWWWHHRIRPTPPINQAVARWDEAVACQGGALPGSWITDPEPVSYTPPPKPCPACNGHGLLLEPEDLDEIDASLAESHCDQCGGTGHQGVREPEEVGWAAIGQLPPGKLNTRHAIQSVESVASAYGVPLPSSVVEGTRTGEYDRFVVRVYRRNPLQDRHDWPGPHTFDPKTGIASVGVYADMAPVKYRFYRRSSGPRHSMICGDTDSGKSRLLDQLLAIERSSPLMASVVIDPQRGQSLPEWKRRVAHYARTAEEGVEVLLRCEQMMLQRNEILSNLVWRDELGRKHEGVDFFDPLFPPIAALQMKLVSITIDEAPAVLAYPDGVRAAENIAKMGRKCGKKLRLVAQLPVVDELGGSSVLKTQVQAGNIFVLRTASRLTGDLVFQGALPVDPVLLPREWPDGSTTAGIGFTLGVEARPAQMRLFFPGDTYVHARRGQTTPVDLPELPAATDAVDQPDAASAGSPEPAGPSGLNDKAGEGAHEGMEQAASRHQPPPNTNGTIVHGTARERVLAFLADRGPEGAGTGVIAGRLGMPMSTAATALEDARKAGQVVKPRRAWWVIARG